MQRNLKTRLRYTFRHVTWCPYTRDIVEEYTCTDIEGDTPSEETKKIALKEIAKNPGWTEEDSYIEQVEILKENDPADDLHF